MAEVKAYIMRDCMDSEKEFLKKGTVLTLDEDKEAKLFELENAVEYDGNIHSEKKDATIELRKELAKVKKELTASKALVKDLQAKVKVLNKG